MLDFQWDDFFWTAQAQLPSWVGYQTPQWPLWFDQLGRTVRRRGDNCNWAGRRRRIPTDGAGPCRRTVVARSWSRGGIRRFGRSAGRVSQASTAFTLWIAKRDAGVVT